MAVLALGLAVYVALVFWDNTLDAGAELITGLDFVYWVILLGTVLALVLAVLIILYFAVPRAPSAPAPEAPQSVPYFGEQAPEPSIVAESPPEPEPPPAEPEAEVIPAPEPDFQPVEEPAPAPAPEPEVVAQPEPATAATPWVAPEPPQQPLAEALLVRCTKCSNEFELPYTTHRPIHTTCPECGSDSVLEEKEDVLRAGGEQVIEIEGIGPEFARKLNQAGIVTTEQLRKASPARLSAQTGIPQTTLDAWRSMADLMRVKGVGKQFAELLVRSGFLNARQLARSTPTDVVRRIKTYVAGLERPPTKAGVSKVRAVRMIRAARAIERR